ncbi:MAG: hypothetical protein OHK0012_25310 [Synechococcales cyanobacterium]
MEDKQTPEETLLVTDAHQPRKVVRTAEELIAAYEQGIRDFSGSDLRGVKLSEAILPSIFIKDGNLKSVNFDKSNFSGSVFLNCDFSGSSFNGVNFTRVSFKNCNLTRAVFRSSDAFPTIFRGSDFVSAILKDVDLSGDFEATNFSKALFSRVTLSGKYNECSFSCSIMKNVTFSTISGYSYPFKGSDFRDAHLRDINVNSSLEDCNFCGARLLGIKGGSFKYSLYDKSTQFDPEFDPEANGMELLEDDSESLQSTEQTASETD